MACVSYDNGLTVCSTVSTVVEIEDIGIKWCFVCRKRVRFVDELHDPGIGSYYDPAWWRYCENRHFDGDLFPGTSYL